MEYKRLCDSNYRFMSIIWDNEPIGSMDLVKLCEDQLGWKKSTTFTMLKKLGEKGLLKNEGSVVTSLAARGSVQSSESRLFVQQTFRGSLPGFLAAFFDGGVISDDEADELCSLIEAHRKERRQ